MTRAQSWLVLGAAIVPLFLAAVAGWVWMTIPPEPDPETLPSRVEAPPAPAYRDVVEQGRTIARRLTAEEKLPGLSLAVAIDGEIVWAEGFRWADMERETPVTPATVFRVGGVSKTLTAAAVGLLVESRRLDLDAPVQRYVPEFPQKEWPVSTRQLMTHTAGIRPFRGEGGLFRGRCSDDAERLAVFAGEPLVTRPGTEVRYSTHGWALLGAVISSAAGEPYLDFLRRQVLEPLGMKSTIPDLAATDRPGAARFYYPRLALDPRYGLQEAPEVDFSCHLPAVGFLSTPSDLVRLASAMMRGELLAPATVEELWRPARLESGESTGPALGWVVAEVALGPGRAPTRIAGQGLGAAVLRRPLSATTVGGQVSGGTATLLAVPGQRLAIAVASNVSGAANVSVLAGELANLFTEPR